MVISFRFLNTNSVCQFAIPFGKEISKSDSSEFLSIDILVVCGFPSGPVTISSASIVSGSKSLLKFGSWFNPLSAIFNLPFDTTVSVALLLVVAPVLGSPTEPGTRSPESSKVFLSSESSVDSSFASTVMVTPISLLVSSAKVTLTFALIGPGFDVSTSPTNSAFASAGRPSKTSVTSTFSPTFTVLSLPFTWSFSSTLTVSAFSSALPVALFAPASSILAADTAWPLFPFCEMPVESCVVSLLAPVCAVSVKALCSALSSAA